MCTCTPNNKIPQVMMLAIYYILHNFHTNHKLPLQPEMGEKARISQQQQHKRNLFTKTLKVLTFPTKPGWGTSMSDPNVSQTETWIQKPGQLHHPAAKYATMQWLTLTERHYTKKSPHPYEEEDPGELLCGYEPCFWPAVFLTTNT